MKCPYCYKDINKDAKICAHCSSILLRRLGFLNYINFFSKIGVIISIFLLLLSIIQFNYAKKEKSAAQEAFKIAESTKVEVSNKISELKEYQKILLDREVEFELIVIRTEKGELLNIYKILNTISSYHSKGYEQLVRSWERTYPSFIKSNNDETIHRYFFELVEYGVIQRLNDHYNMNWEYKTKHLSHFAGQYRYGHSHTTLNQKTATFWLMDEVLKEFRNNLHFKANEDYLTMMSFEKAILFPPNSKIIVKRLFQKNDSTGHRISGVNKTDLTISNEYFELLITIKGDNAPMPISGRYNEIFDYFKKLKINELIELDRDHKWVAQTTFITVKYTYNPNQDINKMTARLSNWIDLLIQFLQNDFDWNLIEQDLIKNQ